MGPTQDPKPAKVTCTDVIKACDKALEDKNQVIKMSDLAIGQLKENNGKLQTDLDRERDKNTSFFRNPVVLLLLGAVSTLVIIQVRH